MRSITKLKEVYLQAKGDNSYYSFEDFISNAKAFIKVIRKHQLVSGMEVSRSGMLRKFNTLHYNMLLNICYNNKYSWEPVKVRGCGMDMYWNLLFVTCSYLLTTKEIEKYSINLACSRQSIL